MATRLNRRNKYGNRKKIIDGYEFDSGLEAERYVDLKMEIRAGMISDLQMQVPIELITNGVVVAKYVADFVYIRNGEVIVDDAKGVETAVFRLKWKQLKAQYAGQYKFMLYPKDYSYINYKALKQQEKTRKRMEAFHRKMQARAKGLPTDCFGRTIKPDESTEDSGISKGEPGGDTPEVRKKTE